MNTQDSLFSNEIVSSAKEDRDVLLAQLKKAIKAAYKTERVHFNLDDRANEEADFLAEVRSKNPNAQICICSHYDSVTGKSIMFPSAT